MKRSLIRRGLDVVISEVNPTEGYAVIENRSEADIALKGWKMVDKSSEKGCTD